MTDFKFESKKTFFSDKNPTENKQQLTHSDHGNNQNHYCGVVQKEYFGEDFMMRNDMPIAH